MGKKRRDDIGRVKMKIDWLELVDEGQVGGSCINNVKVLLKIP